MSAEENDDYKKIKPAAKHFPVTKQEVDSWYDRIEEVTSSIDEFLKEDPAEAADRKAKREAERAATKVKQERERMVQRYDPRYYVRFESDELINKMLQEVESPPPPAPKFDKAHLSNFESVTLKEAETMKQEGNTAFKKGELQEAHHKYSLAIAMEVIDPDLVTALRNNRAQVNILLKNWLEAADDASAVLVRERHNVKALLRRATALSQLHRPVEALVDVEAILRAEPKNVDGLRLREVIARELDDFKECSAYELRVPDDVRSIQGGIGKLRIASDKAKSAATIDTRPDGTVRLPADQVVDAVMNEVVAAVSELLPLFVERASATCFRFRGGLAILVPLVQLLLVELDRKAFASRPSATVAVVASLRLLASALATDLNIERSEGLGPVVDYCAEGATQRVNMNDSSSAVRLLKCSACLNVLEAAARAEVHCSAIVAKIARADMERLLIGTAATNPLIQPALKLVAALLAKGGQAAAERYNGLDVVAPSLAALSSSSIAMQESAVLALLRAAAQPDSIAVLSRKEALRAIACGAVAITNSTSSSVSPVVQEGLYSILYNVTVQTADRLQLATVLSDPARNVFEVAVKSLDYCVGGDEPAAASRWMNVAARHLALLAKFVGVSTDVASQLVEVEDSVLWKVLKNLAADATTRAKDAVSAAANRSDTAVSYPDQCVEHATLCLAHLMRAKLVPVDTLADRPHVDLLLSLLSAPNPITVGNVAIILALTPPATGLEVLEAASGVKVMLASIMRLRGECHAMESAGIHTTASAVYSNMKAAQKNVAVALAKCTARPSMLEQLREQNGIEILSTTM